MMYVVITLLMLILGAIISPRKTKLFMVWSLAGVAAIAATLGAIWLGSLMYNEAMSIITNVSDFAKICSGIGGSACADMVIEVYRDPANADAVRGLGFAGFVIAVWAAANGLERLFEKRRWAREAEARRIRLADQIMRMKPAAYELKQPPRELLSAADAFNDGQGEDRP